MRHQPRVLGRFHFSAVSLAITATLAVHSVAAADESVKELAVSKATAQNEDSYKVQQSTSIKYTQPLLDTAKTITVIPESVMKDRNVDSLRDALRNVSGISLAAGEGGTPTGDSMSIRGFDARNNIMIDGVRDIAGYSRDVYNIEAVEVAKGPGSAMYGRGATGGSINLQSKTAKLEDFSDVSLRLGDESDHRGKLDLNTQVGQSSALRINLLSDDGDVAGRDEVNNSKNAVALSFATGLATDGRLSINTEYQKQDNLPDYGLPWVFNSATSDPLAELAEAEGGVPPVAFSNFYGNIHRDFEKIDARSLTVKYQKDLGDATTIQTLARVGSVERQSIVTAPRFIDLANSTDVRMSDEKTRDTKDSLSVLQVDVWGNYQIGGLDHNVVLGAELAREKFDRWNYVDVVDDNLDSTPVLNDLYHPNPELSYSGQYARGDKSDQATGDTVAVYGFDRITLDPQWQLSFGLRYDIFDTEYFYDLDGTDPTLKLAAKDKQWSWNLGAVYKPSDNGSIYFGAGNSFSPSAEDLTASSRGNNAELDPEETLSYEIGTKWALFDDRLFAALAIFRTEKTHARTDDPFADDVRDDTLNGRQRVDGLELSLAGQLGDKLAITAAYTFQDSKVVTAQGDDEIQQGYELPRTPKHSFSLWGRYEIDQQWAFGLGAQYVGERFNNANPLSRESAAAYMTLDCLLAYRANERWGVQFNASNLGDKAYVEQLGGGHFIPGAGRHMTLTANYSF